MTGAASQRIGRSSIEAPSDWKIRLTFAFCNAKPNWMPRNPKHMFQICQKLSSGCDLRMLSFIPVKVR